MITAEQREAAKLIRAMQPLIEAHFRALPPLPTPPPPPSRSPQVDLNIMAACKRVGLALDRLEEAKFGPAEVRARVTLELATRHLRSVMRAKEARSGH